MGLNSHYIARFLTSPWEQTKRVLEIFDFVKNRFDRKPSKSLFAKQDSLSPEIELRFSTLIEDFAAKARIGLFRGETHIQNKRTSRALILLHHLQATRTFVARYGLNEMCRSILTLSEHDLDELVAALNTKYQHFRVKLRNQDGMFFPSIGVFPIEINSVTEGKATCYAQPLHPQVAFISAPRSLSKAALDLAVKDAALVQWSVGPHSAHQVVIPPGMRRAMGDSKLREALLRTRDMVAAQVSASSRHRDDIEDRLEVAERNLLSQIRRQGRSKILNDVDV